MNIKCYSVRLQSLVRISDKAYKATAYDGSEDIIPVSQVYGEDLEVQKSDAYWITAWILEKKSIQYSTKKECYFDKESRRQLPRITVTKHTPEYVAPIDNTINELMKK